VSRRTICPDKVGQIIHFLSVESISWSNFTMQRLKFWGRLKKWTTPLSIESETVFPYPNKFRLGLSNIVRQGLQDSSGYNIMQVDQSSSQNESSEFSPELEHCGIVRLFGAKFRSTSVKYAPVITSFMVYRDVQEYSRNKKNLVPSQLISSISRFVEGFCEWCLR
jgi:hypothetical protein